MAWLRQYNMIRTKKIKTKYWWQRVSIFKTNVGFCILWIVACAAYVAILNNITVSGYKIKKLEKQIAASANGNNNLRLSLSDKQSMGMVMEKAKSLGMVSADSIKYVSMPSAMVAVKK